MNLVDVIIILVIGLGAVLGFKRGVFKQAVESLGGLAALILSLIFMRPLAMFLMDIGPTFNFRGMLSGISSINVLAYNFIAFLILIIIFSILLRILLIVADAIERVLKATILLAIPSKILGAILGMFEHYLLVFILLFILTLPIFNFRIINEAGLTSRILGGTPIVSSVASATIDTFNDVYAMSEELSNDSNRIKLDEKVLKIMIDNNLISQEKAKDLYEKGKIKVE
ncbi:MAG: CvpA family protein [Mollicutes bacterium]|nr:CvpA family protein [Mollicutes bacterium]